MEIPKVAPFPLAKGLLPYFLDQHLDNSLFIVVERYRNGFPVL